MKSETNGTEQILYAHPPPIYLNMDSIDGSNYCISGRENRVLLLTTVAT